jgi:hypothetical protein
MNPMMIMIGISVLFIFAVPKIMGSLDEETLREIQGNTNPAEPPPKWSAPPLAQ